ncbi:hypothetical protein AXF42_Ash008369 [Apostasia shenzhenica]|uniref:Uncharacterized protein n=1 Tax=Apostasia shenzhenica TaxID=1088818 RepID=A0A2I0AXP0_9ASPA|nr:hypothetical protein AXF42_Ash008369 [Apostasia shenzhenica]
MEMERKKKKKKKKMEGILLPSFFVLLMLVACLHYPLDAVRLPLRLPRALALNNQEEPVAISDLEVLQGEGKRMEEIESNDYPGSGANNRHDPSGPGRN